MHHGDKQEPTFGLDTHLLMGVIASGDVARRTRLARQAAAFLADKTAPAAEREQMTEVAIRLANDDDVEVRRTLASGLASNPLISADLVFTIVTDEDEIALPFLAVTPAVDAPRLIAILRVGDETRQAVVASRPDLPADVLEHITATLPRAVNALLLENAAAPLGASHFKNLYRRFGTEKAILDLLLARPDLPAVLRLIHARRAAASITSLLNERGWLPAANADDLVIDAEENAMLQVLGEASPEDREEAVAYLVDSEMLTPSLIVHAACLGAMDVVAQCLATLAGLPLARAREQMFGDGRFRSLHDRCGLPHSCFWTLKAACDTARDEQEGGTRLSADEFGRRLIEKLLTRYDAIPLSEQPRNLDFIGRFAAEKPRRLAARLKADIQRAA